MLGVLDRLHGTDSLFRASRAYQRHILLLGFVPLSVQFPDDPKQQGKAGPIDLVDQKLEWWADLLQRASVWVKT